MQLKEHLAVRDKVVIRREGLEQLFYRLKGFGFQVLGPTLRNQAIMLDELHSVDDLPIGWTDEQDGGVYRLKRRGDQAYFGYVVGSDSWKKYLMQRVKVLWEARKTDAGFQIASSADDEAAPKFAFIGVRACDLNAISVQDRVFMEGLYADPSYKARREQALIVAVNCSKSCATCFCASMGTGPRVRSGFDLALTEVIESGDHFFLAEVGSELGADMLDEVDHARADALQESAAAQVVEQTAVQMGRRLEANGIKELLYRNYENPRWDNVAERCLTCANCTFVCPTCFCSTVEDVTDLTGATAQRRRRLDWCFTMDHSYLHGGSVRSSPRSRYRQWMTHKLATWIDQFGVSGCVGCGRCITWCPVAIDITEEAAAIRAGKEKPASDRKRS